MWRYGRSDSLPLVGKPQLVQLVLVQSLVASLYLDAALHLVDQSAVRSVSFSEVVGRLQRFNRYIDIDQVHHSDGHKFHLPIFPRHTQKICVVRRWPCYVVAAIHLLEARPARPAPHPGHYFAPLFFFSSHPLDSLSPLVAPHTSSLVKNRIATLDRRRTGGRMLCT